MSKRQQFGYSGLFLFLFKASLRVERAASRIARRLADRALTMYFSVRYDNRIEYQTISRLKSDDAPRWQSQVSNPTQLSIIVVTFRQPAALECLLNSLACQTLQNFNVLVLHDGPDAKTAKLMERLGANTTDHLSYVETTTRFNDYGHSLREIGIASAQGEYTMVTNGDNYYCPRFIEFVFDAVAEERLDLAMWDIIHSHHRAGSGASTSYNPFLVAPLAMRVDIGAFLVRTDLAKKVGFRDKSHDGDITYLEDILNLTDVRIRIGKIQKTLMVHN